MEKEIHWELCKNLKFDHTNSPESVLEGGTHKILWDFGIKTDHLISTGRSDIIIINKKERTCRIIDFAVQVYHRVKLKESENTLLKIWKTVEHESDGYTNYNWCRWYSHQRIGKKTGGPVNNRTGGEYQKYNIIEIGQNTGSGKYHQLKSLLETWGGLLSLKHQWQNIS